MRGYEDKGSYKRDIHYKGASLSQLASLTSVSSHCEQFIKYECYHSGLWFNSPYGWWVSRDSSKMTYWGGASPGSGKCACGMNNSCAARKRCNCDANDQVWREDSGFLTDPRPFPRLPALSDLFPGLPLFLFPPLYYIPFQPSILSGAPTLPSSHTTQQVLMGEGA